MLACNAPYCGTGFSRECGISGDQFRAGVPASSRLKRSAARPIPHENAVVCGSKLACEGDIPDAEDVLAVLASSQASLLPRVMCCSVSMKPLS